MLLVQSQKIVVISFLFFSYVENVIQLSTSPMDTYFFNSSLQLPDKIKNRRTVKIVIYDKVKGYLNWHQDWYKEAAESKCSTRCIISEDWSDVCYLFIRHQHIYLI
jgi:hypothetical protein